MSRVAAASVAASGLAAPAARPLPAIPGWAGPVGGHGGLGACIGRLDAAIAAATVLGLPTADAESIRAEAAERLGFPADAYVLALVGGTGVGKSSLLNALAGSSVSQASARRPTTDLPVAWVARSSKPDLAELLDWLDVAPGDVREHDDEVLGSVAIVDLPDLDSIEPDHRERVEAILPQVDAVAWVTDPEKYHDALLHDEFLRRWIPRLDRQIVVLNKVDRLAIDDAERIRHDLERDLAAFKQAGRGQRTKVVLAAARPSDDDAPPDIRELGGWLTEQVEAKQVVRARLGASISTAVLALARAAGIDPAVRAHPILDGTARRGAIDRATGELLRVVDLPNVERRAVAATRARARARGAGPVGWLTSGIYRLSGRQARVADPAAFLIRWRERGSLAPATEAVRGALNEPLRSAEPATRPVLAASVAPAGLEAGLAGAVDRAIALRGREVPTSGVWTLIGLLQTLATLALVFGTIWVILWVFVKFPADSVVVPVLGHLPVPFLFLTGALAAGYLIARLLGLHAGWVGRRWARRLAAEVRTNVEREVEASAFAGLDQLEATRRALWTAARGVGEDCAG
jgi:hypothetical protein